MGYLNTYTDPEPLETRAYHAETPPSSYDFNSMIPVPEKLESNGILLVPFIPSIHARTLYDKMATYPQDVIKKSMRFIPYGPPSTFDALLTRLEIFRRKPDALLFAAFDKTLFDRDGSLTPVQHFDRFAGYVGFIQGVKSDGRVEIGPVYILPHFHRTHITTHAVGLLMRYVMDDLFYRCVTVFAFSRNTPSRIGAQRMGFYEYGLYNYHRVADENQQETDLVSEDEFAREYKWNILKWKGIRHTAAREVTRPDWFHGRHGDKPVKLLVQELMARPVLPRHVPSSKL